MAATAELFETLARRGLRIVDGQPAQHFGERQHGVAQQHGIEVGQLWVQRHAGLGQLLGLRQDR